LGWDHSDIRSERVGSEEERLSARPGWRDGFGLAHSFGVAEPSGRICSGSSVPQPCDAPSLARHDRKRVNTSLGSSTDAPALFTVRRCVPTPGRRWASWVTAPSSPARRGYARSRRSFSGLVGIPVAGHVRSCRPAGCQRIGLALSCGDHAPASVSMPGAQLHGAVPPKYRLATVPCVARYGPDSSDKRVAVHQPSDRLRLG
jgi:hypothetical protein